MILYGERESETVRSERIEQDKAPEPRRSTARIKAEEYDDTGGLVNPAAWRLHRDVPEPKDPWAEAMRQCDRCEEWHDRLCTHGKDLCAECLWECAECMDEMAGERAYDDDRDEGIA